jgi:hypothetical protein
VARRKAQTYGSVIRCRITAGAFRRASRGDFAIGRAPLSLGYGSFEPSHRANEPQGSKRAFVALKQASGR